MRSEGIGASSEKLTKADVERATNTLTWRLIAIQLLTAGAISAALKFL